MKKNLLALLLSCSMIATILTPAMTFATQEAEIIPATQEQPEFVRGCEAGELQTRLSNRIDGVGTEFRGETGAEERNVQDTINEKESLEEKNNLEEKELLEEKENLEEKDVLKEKENLGEKDVLKEKDSSGFLAWETQIQLGILGEENLVQQAGLTWDEWDRAVAERKEKALQNPITREEILGEKTNLSEAEKKALKGSLDAKEPSLPGEGSPQIVEKDGSVSYIAPKEEYVIQDELDAYELAYRLLELCQGGENTCLSLWNRLSSNDQIVYTFAQISGSQTVLGSVLKLVTDLDGKVVAIFNSLDPATAPKETLITQSQAQEAVLKQLKDQGIKGEVLPAYTERGHFSDSSFQYLEVDYDEIGNEDVRWTVYTTRGEEEPGAKKDYEEEESTNAALEEGQQAESEFQEAQYPYLAHYLSLTGEYLYSLPVKEPRDESSRAGVRVPDLFEGMVTEQFTTVLTRGNGDEVEVSVPVMYNENTHLWYLGDSGERIAIADYAAYVYDENHELVLLSSETKDGWDSEDLFLLYSYLKATHFYQDMGWEGPAGVPAPVILLRNLCGEDGTLMVNACSMGLFRGFQLFGYTPRDEKGNAAGLGACLDVLVHEFTHSLTSTMMVTNLYLNDPGAINEAMSDIMGNLGEYIMEGTTDPYWLINEACGSPIRSMSNPELYTQPEYVWDTFYGPAVKEPTLINDRGGVHINSSLLNQIGAKLCLEEKMSYEQAVRLWLDIAMCITPKMDYPQMAVLLRHGLKVSGNEAYREGLEALIEKTRLTTDSLPERLNADQRLIRLQLPDTEAFQDKNWSLDIYQINTDVLNDITVAALEGMIAALNKKEFAPQLEQILTRLAGSLQLDNNRLVLKDKAEEDVLSFLEEFFHFSRKAVKKLLIIAPTWPHDDSREILAVVKNYPTIYMLSNIQGYGSTIDALAILFKDTWIDIRPTADMGESLQVEEDDLLQAIKDISANLFPKKNKDDLEKKDKASLSEKISSFDFLGLLDKVEDTILHIKERGDTQDLEEYLNELFSHPAVPIELSNKGLEKIQLASQVAEKAGESAQTQPVTR